MTIYDRPIKNGREHIAQEFLTALLEWETSDATDEAGPAGVSLLSAIPVGEAATTSTQAPPVVERERPSNVPGAQAAVAV